MTLRIHAVNPKLSRIVCREYAYKYKTGQKIRFDTGAEATITAVKCCGKLRAEIYKGDWQGIEKGTEFTII